ncbi:fatty acid synthase subunit beta [Penicillium pulvis]|uniref:fatty acid synthase subunit beta n=1 Tax=Penicillium pulvis TaxID=1562058 RepID=UPI002547B23B|nr:fatty acid synthase subunit beta [Penicillium pulvis]KAJ5813857.1 fatty acid synthase subunit beta [Penicillium pulvis]
MQLVIERDDQGRTNFSMVAVNPARVGKFFTERALRNLVEMIATTTNALLEIVNFNVEGEQYVCAGMLGNLHALGAILNYIAKAPNGAAISRGWRKILSQRIASASCRGVFPKPNGWLVPSLSSVARPRYHCRGSMCRFIWRIYAPGCLRTAAFGGTNSRRRRRPSAAGWEVDSQCYGPILGEVLAA